ncbi:MAG: glucokinase [Cyanobacteria bacterium RI_101]|nr:glucokinase [Cyanobacteria bacterium RI_101]
MLLAADIGGTSARFRLLSPQLERFYFEQVYVSREFESLAAVLARFLTDAAQFLGASPQIQSAALGVAGPVVDNTCDLTNLDWAPIQGEALARKFAIPRVTLINDFTAIGYGVVGFQQDPLPLGLKPQDLITLQEGHPQKNTPIALLGAGTGMGQGFLIPQGEKQYRVFPSEGGHTAFAPQSPLEFALVTDLKAQGLTTVSVEDVVSGAGIVNIYGFLRRQFPQQETEDLKDLYRRWQAYPPGGPNPIDLAAAISEQALAGNDALCLKTLELFVSAYGAEAGNWALKLLAFGGVYLAGGIAAKILPLLTGGAFLDAFRDKGSMSHLMPQFPVYLIRNSQIGLLGAGIRAALGPD